MSCIARGAQGRGGARNSSSQDARKLEAKSDDLEAYLSYNLNSSKGVYIGGYIREYCRVEGSECGSLEFVAMGT